MLGNQSEVTVIFFDGEFNLCAQECLWFFSCHFMLPLCLALLAFSQSLWVNQGFWWAGGHHKYIACAGMLFILQLAGCSFTSWSQSRWRALSAILAESERAAVCCSQTTWKEGRKRPLDLEHFSLISFILCKAFSGLLKEAWTGLCCITRMNFIFRKIKSSFLTRQIKFATKLQWWRTPFSVPSTVWKATTLLQIAVGHKLAVMWTSKRGS